MADRVRKRREELGLDVETLALRLGVPERQLRSIESDEEGLIDVRVALKLARVLNTTVEDLFGGSTLGPRVAEAATDAASPAALESEISSPLFDIVNLANGLTDRASLRRVYPPRGSRKSSSYFSKTARTDDAATSPRGLVDPTLGRPIRYFDLFCGIGGFRYGIDRALKNIGREGECALSCDSDKYARESYAANFGDAPVGDVAALPSDAIPDFDVLCAGFPCQSFSIIGLKRGFEDETKGALFFEIARILRDKRPRAFILENVRSLTTHDGGRAFEVILRVLQDELDYCVDWRIMNALDCGLPQKRERVLIVGSTQPFEMEWPRKKTSGKTLRDILQDDRDVPRKYYASSKIISLRHKKHKSQFDPGIWHENKSGVITSYPYSCALRAGASHNYLLVNGERRLTPLEMLRLQGFPDDFKIVVSDAQIRKQIGNAVPVNMIEMTLNRFLPLVFQSEAH